MNYQDDYLAVLPPKPKSLYEPAQDQDFEPVKNKPNKRYVAPDYDPDPESYPGFDQPAEQQQDDFEKFGQNPTGLVRSNRLSRQGCGEKIVKMRCKSCGLIHAKVYYCGSRICPDCAKRRQKEILAKLFDVCDSIKVPYGMSYKMITLTIKKTTFDHDIPRALSGLTKINHNIFEKYGIGSVAHLEVSPNGMIHWHILFLGKYIPKKVLSDEWFRITGDSWRTRIDKVHGLKSGLYEICKYITKFAETPERLLLSFYERIRYRRIFRTLGVFYNKDIDGEQKLLCEKCGGTEWKFIGIEDPDEFTYKLIFDEQIAKEGG